MANTIKANKLSMFTGSTKGDQGIGLREWLLQYYGQPGQPSVGCIQSYLDGEARQWFSIVAHDRAWTAEALILRLGARFDDQTRNIKALKQLRNLSQGSTQIATHNQTFMQLAQAAQCLTDADIVERYAGTLNEQSMAVIRREKLFKGHALTGVMRKVQKEVQDLLEFNAKVSAHRSGSNTNSSNNRGYNSAASTSSAAAAAADIGDDPVELGAMQMRNTQCHRCKGWGHRGMQRDCPTPENPTAEVLARKCFKCRGGGHMSNDCPSPKQQQQQQRKPRHGNYYKGRYGNLHNHKPKQNGKGDGGSN